MNKKTMYECQSCSYQSGKWLGKCPNCGHWDTLIELFSEQRVIDGAPRDASVSKAIPVTDVRSQDYARFGSGEEELDIVLGGGIVPGGLYLVGGSPGVGKSTLLLKIMGNVARTGKRVLYVSGEESPGQISIRAKRCDCIDPRLYLLSETDLRNIMSILVDFEMCVVDSIQTVHSPDLSAAAGSVSQVRHITFCLMRVAKELSIPIFIIGHITKDGQIAGPRVLEHMVDCVLYFEGERSNDLKILRGFKNRFGTTSEIGIFEMTERGIVSSTQATKRLFSNKKDVPGSAAVAIMEGSRCLVVEVQSLVSPVEFGIPKRLANGFDSNRLNMILALLDKKLGVELHRFDVFINVAGGIKISETSADLALIASILSSLKNRPLKSSTAFIGEVSLIGDIREVSSLESRLRELSNFGFKNVIVPEKPPNLRIPVACIVAKEVTQIIEWM